ncbi:hypothetical protein ACNVED_03755 [Legionella sp. D16C41]|uniref:hypothetical protein n=1 Tax=Legionella sp. D16C41 TaxID=3402688 RepID=UPI003AF5F152
MKQQQGIILLTTAVFLSLITLLLLAQIELVNLSQKSLNQFIIHEQALHFLETIALRVTNQLSQLKQNTSCVTKSLEPNDVINSLKKQQLGCLKLDKTFTYRYLAEYLGKFNCIRIKLKEKTYATEHWRLTIALLKPQVFILQLRVAQVTDYSKACKQPVIIESGVLSWRYLT